MITILTKIYESFQCKADKCQHSCCKKWEIDIDEYTADMYMNMAGTFGDELRRNMETDGQNYHFRLTSDENCPFLQENGLCRLILEIGEENLCDICASHPRFFVMAKDVELGGIGLSCEKGCELLLADDEPLLFTMENTAKTFAFDEVLHMLNITPIPHSMNFTPNTSEEYVTDVLHIMGDTEPIDNIWTAHIAELQENPAARAQRMNAYQQECKFNLFNKIYQHILYRGLQFIDQYTLKAITSYANISANFIMLEAAVTGDLHEALRRWSEQIEYSTDNCEIILKSVKM